MSVLFLIVVSQSLYVKTISTFCTWTGSLKWTPLPCQFSWWSIRLDLPQLKLVCLNCQKTDIWRSSPWWRVLLWKSCSLNNKNVLEWFLQYSQEKTCAEFIRTPILKNMATSEPTSWNECLELCFWIPFKTILTH